MKNIKFLFVALILAVGAVSCDDEPTLEPAKPIIKLDAAEVGIDAYGKAVDLAYTIENRVDAAAASLLSFSHDAEWLTVEVSATNITLSATRNEEDKHRTADVVFSYEGAESVSLKVLQAGGAEEDIAKLEIEVTSVGSTTITFDLTASHPDLTWIPMVTYAEHWTEPVNDEEIFIYDLEYFKYLAETYGISLEEFLSEMLGKGSQKDITIERLDPSTEYVIYAYGLSLDGTRLTDIVWATATTEEPYEGDITFEFDITETDFVLDFVVTPSHLGVDFFYGIASEAEIAEWKEAVGSDDLAAAIQYGDIEYTMQLLMDYNFIDERVDYYDMFNCYNVVDDGWAEVNAGTTYILYAAKWNKNCEITGAVSTAEYTTPNANLSDNVITVEITEITQSSVSVEMTTTSNDPYVVMPVRTDVIEGMTDEEIYAFVVEEYSVLVNEYTFSGNWSKTFGRMRPGTEYTILAFGNLAGVQTTDMIKLEISTLASGDPKDCTFETLCVPDDDNVWLEIIPSDKGHHYFYEIYPADYTEEDVKSFIEYVVAEDYEGNLAAFSSWRLYQGDLTTTEEGLHPTTDYKLGIIIMNYDTGEFLSDVYFSEVFTTTEMTYADVHITLEWDKYFDADELVAAGYQQFASSSGEFILPVSVVIEGDYSEFSFNFYNRDLTDENVYADDIFYSDLNSGYRVKSAIIGLPYDTEMTAVAVAYDLGYNPGKLFRKLVNYSKSGASPVSEFGVSQQSLPVAKSLVVDMEPAVESVGSVREQPLVYDDDEAMILKARAYLRESRLDKAVRAMEHRAYDVDTFHRRMVR